MFQNGKFIVFIIAACFIFYRLSYSSDEINMPVLPQEPVIEDLQIPQLKVDEPVLRNGEANLFLIRAKIKFSDNTVLEGTIRLSNNILFYITNISGGLVAISTLSLYDIDVIDVVKWKPEKKDKDTYLFTPIEYRFYTNQNIPSYITYNGNIEIFNSFEISNDSYGRKLFYTLFYDNWIAGKKGLFRWENSRATSFSYNFDHPISGVVQSLLLLK